MKVFEQRQDDGSRKLMGTPTNDVATAVEVTLKGSDGSTSTFDFSKQYHYVAPGAFAVTETEESEEDSEEEVVLNMYIGDLRVVPPILHYDVEDEESEEESEEEK